MEWQDVLFNQWIYDDCQEMVEWNREMQSEATLSFRTIPSSNIYYSIYACSRRYCLIDDGDNNDCDHFYYI